MQYSSSCHGLAIPVHDENLSTFCLCRTCVFCKHFTSFLCEWGNNVVLFIDNSMDGPALCAMTEFPKQIIKLFFDYNNIGKWALSGGMQSNVCLFHFSHQCFIIRTQAALRRIYRSGIIDVSKNGQFLSKGSTFMSIRLINSI